MYKLLYGLSLCLLASFFSLSTAFAQENSAILPLSRGQDVFFTEMSQTYYFTEDNYTQPNVTQSLDRILGVEPGDSRSFFQYWSTELSLGYSPAKWFEGEIFTSGFWFAQSGNGNQLGFKGPHINRIGMAFRTQQRVGPYFGFIPEFSFSTPFFTVDRNSSRPITDDGALHLNSSVWFHGVVAKVFFPFTQLGFKYRNQFLSSSFYWKAGGMLRADIVELGAYGYGFLPLVKDAFSSKERKERQSLLTRTNAGSLKFYSSNPTVIIGFAGWLAWRFPNFSFRLSGDIDVNGSNYGRGHAFLASVVVELTRPKKSAGKNDIFDKQKKQEEFSPQVSEEIREVEASFNNIEEDTAIQKEAEKALEEAEVIEETKTNE